jgi:hypothetical protein
MRRFLIALAITLLPSFAIAAHGGGHMGGWGGGHMGGWGGGHMGGWGGHPRAAMIGGWRGGNWHHAAFRHGRFFHRHNRFFFVGAPFFAAYGYDCWRWVPTAWGVRRIWVCDY